MTKPKKRETLVLLDTHAIIHRAYHALPPLSSPTGESVVAVYGLTSMLIKIAKELKPDHIIAAYDLPGPTHRHEVYKEYKAKRPKLDDELILGIQRSRDVLAAFGIPVYEAPGFEADDIIGTIARIAQKRFDVIIASGDMDTLQLIDGTRVRVYTLRKGIQDTVLYDEQAVESRYGFKPERIPDYKGFAGDPSDNIIGIPGVGEKTATQLISVFGSMDGVYKAISRQRDVLVKKGFRERISDLVREHQDEAEFSKILATIRTDAPVTFREPDLSFAESLDVGRVAELMTELGFRSLIPRVQSLIGYSQGASKKNERDSEADTPSSLFQSSSFAPEEAPLYKEAAVMLWLTRSDITNPTLDDVLHNTKASSLREAHTILTTRVRDEELERVYEDIERPLIPVIDAMNAHGILVDRSYLANLSREYRRDLMTLERKIYDSAGEEFNINSPRQLSEMLFGKLALGASVKRQKKTATGQISTKESELSKYAEDHEIVRFILEYRELQKLLSTYIDAIPPLIKKDGRLHTTFIQTGTTTGRLASKDPNLQNIPIKSESGKRIRRAFIAPEGRLLVSFDYSQIELRLAAVLSGDEKLRDIFRAGHDVHAAVAAEVFKVVEDAVTYDMRRRAKVINFGILYGMGVNALKDSLGTDRSDAQSFYNRYFETFSTLAQYLEKTKAETARRGYTTTYFGRRRYFPTIRSKLPYLRAQAERMAINAPLQGTQSDIMKIAMSRVHKQIMEHYVDSAALILQIHDELIFEVDQHSVKRFADDTRSIMQEVLTRHELHGVPLLVSSNAGPNWAELNPIDHA